MMDRAHGSASNAHVGARLSGYLDGELTQQDRQRVEIHLSTCQQRVTGYTPIFMTMIHTQ